MTRANVLPMSRLQNDKGHSRSVKIGPDQKKKKKCDFKKTVIIVFFLFDFAQRIRAPKKYCQCRIL